MNARQKIERHTYSVLKHFSKGEWCFHSREFKINVFLTREEAEAALKGAEE